VRATRFQWRRRDEREVGRRQRLDDDGGLSTAPAKLGDRGGMSGRLGDGGGWATALAGRPRWPGGGTSLEATNELLQLLERAVVATAAGHQRPTMSDTSESTRSPAATTPTIGKFFSPALLHNAIDMLVFFEYEIMSRE